MEESKERGVNYEQRQWEEDHLNAALLKFGAKDSKERRKVGGCRYLLIDASRILKARLGEPMVLEIGALQHFSNMTLTIV